jgi:hypothetical protein
MKKILLYAFCTILCTASAIHATAAFPTPFAYKAIEAIPGTKDQLYLKAYEWLAKSFTSRDVIQLYDKESGKLIGDGTIETRNTAKDGIGDVYGNDLVHYKIVINIKDGGYTCQVSNYIHQGGSERQTGSSHYTAKSFGSLDADQAPFQRRRYQEVKEQTEAKTQALLQSLKQAMMAGDTF